MTGNDVHGIGAIRNALALKCCYADGCSNRSDNVNCPCSMPVDDNLLVDVTCGAQYCMNVTDVSNTTLK